MATVAMSGSDSVNINNRIFNDLADGNCFELTFPNKISVVKIGKNGNAIYGLNQTGLMAESTLRLIRGSADDKFMQGLLATQNANFAGFVLMIGTFTKQIGHGDGNITADTYITSGGVFVEQVGAKMNVEGDTEQSVAIYKIDWSNAPRALT